MKDYHGEAPYYNHREYRIKYAKGYRGPSQHTIGERPRRGDENLRSYRANNQVNRGRGQAIDRNERRGDRSYDRRGNENKNVKRAENKKEKTDRSNNRRK
jgi:hypothetical protein